MRKTVRRMGLCAVLAWLAAGSAVLHAQTQDEMNNQADYQFKLADAELNKVYKALVAGLSKEDLEELKAAQRLWVQFRDAQADFEADLEARGGSMRPLSFSRWRAQITRTRTAELRDLLKINH